MTIYLLYFYIKPGIFFEQEQSDRRPVDTIRFQKTLSRRVRFHCINFVFLFYYNQTCIRRPLLGPLKRDRLEQVVVL